MSLPTKTIAITAVVIIVLVVFVSFFILGLGKAQSDITECQSKGGVCTYSCNGGSVGVFKCGDSLVEEDDEGRLTIDAVAKPVCCLFDN